jgi:hypothetical protein
MYRDVVVEEHQPGLSRVAVLDSVILAAAWLGLRLAGQRKEENS